MITEPIMGKRRKHNYVAIPLAVPIPLGKYLQLAWDEVCDWMV